MQARLDVALLGGMLGSASTGVFPGPAVLAWLRRRFTLQEASIVGLQRSLQVSAPVHHRPIPNAGLDLDSLIGWSLPLHQLR